MGVVSEGPVFAAVVTPGSPFVGSSLTHSSPRCLEVTAGREVAVVTGAGEPPPAFSMSGKT